MAGPKAQRAVDNDGVYITPAFNQTDVTILHQAIVQHPFGTLLTTADGLIEADHLPFVLDTTAGNLGVLRGHVSRSNPVWRTADNAEVLVVFHGAQGYISPSWYPSKAVHGRVVPTWNYIVVHARGTLRVIDDAEWLRHHLQTLTDEHESRREMPWAVIDAPADYVSAMITGVVGIEIPLRSLVGKWKLSQNRGPDDRAGVIGGLKRERTGDTLVDEVLAAEPTAGE